ncbi:helix-turn-helix transcriptional regulator [Streptomyces sp. NBC_01335]|uniref:winged helix-turn-helix transcriptional regulator n=1 Tax=Streptomyces sp. NBC_01335 TaxID=2903828 RepID=UPI002E1051EE|nr:helix-turn-helix transcriptional regulator [Streptomyces sp. NBC_01335]
MTTTPVDPPSRTGDVYAALCPARDVLDVLSGKWSALAIGALEEGPRRFTSLQICLQGVSPKVLTRTLRRLEDYGFITRTVIAQVPVRVDYALTDLGHGAAAPLAHLRHWVETNTQIR